MLFYSGSRTGFLIGLGMAAAVSEIFENNAAVGMGLTALIVGFYFLMGLFGQRAKAWAFCLGLALYAVDALIYIVVADWMPVAFHAFAIFCIAKGVLRLREMNQVPVAANDSV